jgi:hypothetical protein
VYGVLSDGYGSLTDATFSFNCLKGSTINVLSNGDGLKAGIYQSASGTGNQMSTRDMNIYVAKPADEASIGTYIGIHTDNANSQIQLRSTTISGSPYKGTTTNTAVKVVTISNVASLSGTTTIQGVALGVGDRILLAGQTTASQNGIYVVASGAWSRAADMAAGSNASNSWIPVTSGTYAGQSWLCVSAPAVVGTNLSFKLSFAGADVKIPVSARYTGGDATGSRTAQGDYSPTNGDRLLLTGATSGIDNGIRIYNSGGTWTRAGDMPVGSNSLNSYCLIRYGTDAETAWICTTTGTVDTDSVNFVQKYLGADIVQSAPQAGNLTNGIQIGPGTDLVTKTSTGKPFTTYVYPTTLVYGLKGNLSNATAYLWFGLQTSADNTQNFYRFQQKTIVQGMSINCRTSPGTSNVTVTVLKSLSGVAGTGVATPMSITFTDGTYNIQNYGVAVEFEQGTFLALQVVSDGNINGIDMTVEVDAF